MIHLDAARKRLRPAPLGLPPIVRLLEQADEFERLVNARVVNHRADLARRVGLTRARVTQIMNLLKLHPDIVAYVRSLPVGTPPRRVTERKLRALTRLPVERQVAAAIEAIPGFAGAAASVSTASPLAQPRRRPAHNS